MMATEVCNTKKGKTESEKKKEHDYSEKDRDCRERVGGRRGV